MGKYIRTKDGVYDLKLKAKYENDQKTVDFFVNNYYGGYNNFVKGGDTIEELCDEFVFEDMDGHYLCDFCEQTDIDVGSKFDELKYWFNHSKEQQYKTRNCYGAIWTDKGLIYVAKMNENGELELL